MMGAKRRILVQRSRALHSRLIDVRLNTRTLMDGLICRRNCFAIDLNRSIDGAKKTSLTSFF